MAAYYYFVSSLPMLNLDGVAPTNSSSFLEAAADWLTADDLVALEATRLEPAPTHAAEDSLEAREEEPGPDRQTSVRREFAVMEHGLRNALVHARAGKLSRDPAAYVRPHAGDPPLDVSDVAREAVAEESPLRAERTLDRYRWSFLDQLEVGHYFDIERLQIYYLKLQLLERSEVMSVERGEARFEELYEKTMETMQRMED